MKASTIVCGLFLAGALNTGFAAQGTPQKSPQEYTCGELLVTDFEYVPEIVYWHDGWNAKTDTLTETIGEDWEPVAVDDVWADCQKDPNQKVADVVAKQRQKQHDHRVSSR